ncbi:hypothetical protein [Streptomyces sp. NPDC088760]|uniref:hypothetical protein n=1 Tax=Streptomyces sp. NPDC088760 TaxID=3365890 RepID=UPI0037F510B4
MLGLVGAVKTATDDVRPDCYKHFAEWNNDGGEGLNRAVDCTHESEKWREKTPRPINLLVCAFIVLGALLGVVLSVVGWATLGGNDGPPECAKHLTSTSGTSEAGRKVVP